MLHFTKGVLPEYKFSYAIKKPIPQRVVQIQEDFTVETMEGILQAKAGDYLMIGIEGEMYSCDRKVFEKTYQIVENP